MKLFRMRTTGRLFNNLKLFLKICLKKSKKENFQKFPFNKNAYFSFAVENFNLKYFLVKFFEENNYKLQTLLNKKF